MKLALALLLAATGLALPATADVLTGTLEVGAADMDLFEVTCGDDGNGPPASLVISIEDTAPAAAPLVSAQILKGNAATSTTDPIDADGSTSSPVAIDGGAGLYEVFVDKSAAGAESYALDRGQIVIGLDERRQAVRDDVQPGRAVFHRWGRLAPSQHQDRQKREPESHAIPLR